MILTNNGFVVFMMVFSDVIRHLFSRRGRKFLLNPANTNQLGEEINRLLEPAIQYITEERSVSKQIVKGTGHAPQMANALDLVRWIYGFYPEFCPPRLSYKVPFQPDKAPLPARALIRERAAQFEPILRRYVLDKLAEWYPNAWWKYGLLGGLKQSLDGLWQKALKSSPELRREQDPNRKKFDYCTLGQLADLIMFGENWDNGRFVAIFPCEKNDVKRHILEIAATRDAKSHGREETIQELLDTASSLRWFSECLSDRSLNPYAESDSRDSSEA